MRARYDARAANAGRGDHEKREPHLKKTTVWWEIFYGFAVRVVLLFLKVERQLRERAAQTLMLAVDGYGELLGLA